jgi:Uma2 family endonuclease
MTIVTQPTRPAAVRSPSSRVDERGAIRDVSWKFYDRLSDAIETGSIRMAYDGKDVEIMTLGPAHEGLSGLLRQFLDLVLDGLEVDCLALGSTTWKRPELDRGIEADQCYVFDPAKCAAGRAALARMSNDLADYPNPDLAVEIDIAPSKIDRPGIYAALKVFEIWHCDDEGRIMIDQLGDDNQYAAVDSSRFLHVRPEELMHWLTLGASTERTQWRRLLKKWVEAEIKPRAEGGRQ